MIQDQTKRCKIFAGADILYDSLSTKSMQKKLAFYIQEAANLQKTPMQRDDILIFLLGMRSISNLFNKSFLCRFSNNNGIKFTWDQILTFLPVLYQMLNSSNTRYLQPAKNFQRHRLVLYHQIFRPLSLFLAFLSSLMQE